MRFLLLLLSLVLFTAPLPLRAEEKANWVADYDAATEMAARQNRMIFVLFTNSKVCVPCRILKENVLTKPEFLDYAARNLVLLQIDYAPYHDKENKKDLNEIEREKNVPKELWMQGRGPWPYLFVLSPAKEVLYSGKASDPTRTTVADYLKFLDALKK